MASLTNDQGNNESSNIYMNNETAAAIEHELPETAALIDNGKQGKGKVLNEVTTEDANNQQKEKQLENEQKVEHVGQQILTSLDSTVDQGKQLRLELERLEHQASNHTSAFVRYSRPNFGEVPPDTDKVGAFPSSVGEMGGSKFKAGEQVLCFESTDVSKLVSTPQNTLRVLLSKDRNTRNKKDTEEVNASIHCGILYDCKILRVLPKEYSKEKRQQIQGIWYIVEFQVEKLRWKRTVQETTLLKLNQTNLNLQKELLELIISKPRKEQKYIKENLPLARNIIENYLLNKSSEAHPKNEIALSESESEESAEFIGGLSIEEELSSRIKVPVKFKNFLNWDFKEIKRHGKLVRPSAEMANVLQILEDFVKHSGFHALAKWSLNNPTTLVTANGDVGKKLVRNVDACDAAEEQALSLSAKNRVPGSFMKICDKIAFRQFIVTEIWKLFDIFAEKQLIYNEEEVLLASLKGKRTAVKHFTLTADNYPILHYNNSTTTASIAKENNCQPFKLPDKGKSTMVSFGKGMKSIAKNNETVQATAAAISNGRNDIMCDNYLDDYVAWLTNWTLSDSDPNFYLGKLYDTAEAKPTVMFGVVHLLRFLLHLPEIVSKLGMEKFQLAVLANCINDILRFIDVNHYTLQVEYVPANEALEAMNRRTWVPDKSRQYL